MKGLKWMKDPLKRCNFQKSMELFVGFVCSNAQSHLKRFKVGRNPPNPSRFVALFHHPQSLSGCVDRPMPDQSLNHRKFIRWKKNSVEKSPQRLAFFSVTNWASTCAIFIWFPIFVCYLMQDPDLHQSVSQFCEIWICDEINWYLTFNFYKSR